MEQRRFAGLRKFVPAALAAAMLCAPVFAGEVSDVSALLRAKQYDAALALANEHLARKPDDLQMRFVKGLALAGTGQRDAAIAYFTKLSSEHPEMPELYNNLAVLQAAAGHVDQARVALEAAVKANPTYARAHENLGDMYLQLAGQSYAAVLKLEPHNADVRAKQALLLSAASHGAERAPASGQEAGVVAAIEDWARAWSARDATAYLAFYSPAFHTPGNIARAAWEAERRARLKDAAVVNVTVGAPEVTIDGDKATASFDQIYRSDRVASRDRKTLTLEQRDGQWKILREESRK